MNSGSKLIMQDGKAIELSGKLTVGRHPQNEVVVDDDMVPRQHALIQWQSSYDDPSGGSFLLVDLGSSNGTLLNGIKVSRPTKLKDGDELEFGSVKATFKSNDQAGQEDSYYKSTIIANSKRKTWLMVADIIDSSSIANQIDPATVPQIIGSWFKDCRECIEKHGGQMDKYLGDGFFCHWNDGPEIKARIIEMLRDFIDKQEHAEIPFRIALHYGETIMSSIPTMPGMDLHGPSVNFVFRMEKIAASLGTDILLSSEAMKKLGLQSAKAYEAEVQGYEGNHSFHKPELIAHE